MAPKQNLSFDRIAQDYDETRGGLPRGQRFAETIAGHLRRDDVVLEVGVGTGLVAVPLAELGYNVVGFDISDAMLRLAGERIPGRIGFGDTSCLPVASGSVDAVVAVWALHVVADRDAMATELARVLRPGGTLLTVSPTPDVDGDDIHDTTAGLSPGLGISTGVDRSEELAPFLEPFGFTFEADEVTDEFHLEQTPNERADQYEARVFSMLWDVDDATWARVVQPIIDDLRRLPEPDRPRQKTHRHILSTYHPT